jgi:hypothetical protein
MKKLVFSILFVIQTAMVLAQSGTGFTGKVVDENAKTIINVVAEIQNTSLTNFRMLQFTFKMCNWKPIITC